MVKHRREIDGLRALAILPVLFYHAGFSWIPGGFFGVDVFFVISGFLITGIIVNELHATGRFSLAGFYERRARRILPALFLVIGVMYPVGWFLLVPDQFQNFNDSLRSIVLFVSNYFFLGIMGYFDPNIDLNPMLHTWSLAIEEQFYIFFPLILWLVWKFVKERYWIPLLSVLGVASLLWAQNNYAQDPNGTFYLLQFRAWELIAGAMAAIHLSHRAKAKVETEGQPYTSQWLSLLGFGMVAYSMFFLDASMTHPGFVTLIPVIGTVLIIMFAGVGTFTNRVLSMRVFVGIGLISYSAYLWHQPIFAFFRVSQLHEPTPVMFLPLIALTMVLSWGSWKFVENPFRNRKRFKRRFILTAAATSMLLIFTGSWAAGHASVQKLRTSFSGQSFDDLQKRVSRNYGLNKDCASFDKNLEGCTFGENPDTLLWGDSYAMHAANALKSGNNPLSFIQHSMSACNPVLELAQQNPSYGIPFAKKCIAFNRETLTWLAKQPAIKYVILGSPWSTVVAPDAKVYNGLTSEVGPAGAAGWKQFQVTLSAIKSLGKTPVVLTPTPTDRNDHGSCVLRALANQADPTQCNFPLDTDTRRAFNTQLQEKASEVGVNTFWWDKFICRTGTCQVVGADTIVYRDAGHLSREGSTYLGETYDIGKQIIEVARNGSNG